MRKMNTVRIATLVALAFTFAASASHAETDYMWPRFSVSAGAYQISNTDKISVSGEFEVGNRKIDLGKDIGLPDSDTLIAGRIDWAFAERHSLDLSYYSYDRSGSRSIGRVIEVGDHTYPVGAEVSANFKTTSLELGYTYWFTHHDTFGFGGTFGLVALALDADASASAALGGTVGTISDSVSASTDVPVPMIGVNLRGMPVNRLVLFGRARFLPSVTIDKYSGQAASYTVGAEYYIVGPVALGVSYDGEYYRADVDDSSWNGSVDLDTAGFRFFVRASF